MATALSLKFFVFLLSFLATLVAAQDCGYCKNCMKARTEQIRDYESQSILAKWPWMVSFGFYDPGDPTWWYHNCGGAVISNHVIITAAHCFKTIDENQMVKLPNGRKSKLLLKLGDEYLNSPEESDVHSRVHEISSVRIHPKYNQGQHFDIALVSTNLSIEFNELTRPLCIPQQPKEKNEEGGFTAYLTGWGLDDDFDIRNTDHLKEGVVSTWSTGYCQGFYESYSDHHLCAGNERGEVGSCPGDSGAPLVKYMSHKEKPYYQLIGVLHGSSDRCRKETAVSAPGLYARVEQSEIHDFIIKTKKELELCHKLKDCFCELKDKKC